PDAPFARRGAACRGARKGSRGGLSRGPAAAPEQWVGVSRLEPGARRPETGCRGCGDQEPVRSRLEQGRRTSRVIGILTRSRSYRGGVEEVYSGTRRGGIF